MEIVEIIIMIFWTSFESSLGVNGWSAEEIVGVGGGGTSWWVGYCWLRAMAIKDVSYARRASLNGLTNDGDSANFCI